MKNKTFCYLCNRKIVMAMIIAKQVKQKINAIPEGVVLGIKDFQVETQYEPALVKALNRLVQQGELERLSKREIL